MSGDKVIIIEPSSSGLLLIAAARELGLDPVVVTYNQGDRAIPREHLAMAGEVLVVDTSDEVALDEVVGRYLRGHRVVGVVPGFEYHVPIAARLGHRYQLRGLDPQAVDAVRLKSRMRDQLRASGVAVPRYVTVKGRSRLGLVEERVGYPCVIKPINGSGSRQVTRVESRQELEAAYDELCRDTVLDMGLRLSAEAIVEAYVPGPEFSVEGYVHEGEVRFVSVTEKILGKEPHFTEMGHIVSARLSPEESAAVLGYTRAVVEALQINLGPFHCELRVSSGQPIAMELGARLPGDSIVELIQESTGINLARVMLQSYAGMDIDAPPRDGRRYAGVCFFTLGERSSFREVEGVSAVERLPGFKRFELLAQPGAYVPPPTSSLGRAAKAIFTAPTYPSLREEIRQARSMIRFV